MDQSIAEQALTKVWGKGRGLPPKRGLSFTDVLPPTGKRPVTKMGEGFQRCRRRRRIVQPRDWTRQHVTPRRTDSARGMDYADMGVGVWEVPPLDAGFRNEEHTRRHAVLIRAEFHSRLALQ